MTRYMSATSRLIRLRSYTPHQIQHHVNTRLTSRHTLHRFLRTRYNSSSISIHLLASSRLPISLTDQPSRTFLMRYRVVNTVRLLRLIIRINRTQLRAGSRPIRSNRINLISTIRITNSHTQRSIQHITMPSIRRIIDLMLIYTCRMTIRQRIVTRRHMNSSTLTTTRVFTQMTHLRD